MSSIIDLSGMTFGRWTVHGIATCTAPIMWDCICSCGTRRDVFGGDLKRGSSISCGCHRDEKSAARLRTHGMARHPSYESWKYMKSRCSNLDDTGYYLYGARGVTVCDQWQTFEGFWGDMGSTWQKGLSIDRIDSDGNYDPSNCKWSTPKEQANNRRTNRLVTMPDGRRMTISEAAELHGIKPVTIFARIRYGWPESELFKPARPTKRKYPCSNSQNGNTA